MTVEDRMERLKAWRCIGCGRIEAPQTCIGVCEDRKVELVYAFDHEQALARARLECRQEADALRALVRLFARTTPREGEWERSYRALQSEARRVLAGSWPGLAGDAHGSDL
jgi:hypothetical protein